MSHVVEFVQSHRYSIQNLTESNTDKVWVLLSVATTLAALKAQLLWLSKQIL